LVPIVTLVALWAVDSAQLYSDWQRQQDRNDVSTQAARPVLGAFFSLQEERRLSAAALADPAGYQKQLTALRTRTDAAVKADEARHFRTLMADSAWKKKTAVEQAVLAGSATGGDTDRFSKKLGRDWRDSVQQVTAQLQVRNAAYAKTLTAATDKQLQAMETR